MIDYVNLEDIRIGDACHLSTYKMKEKDIKIGYKFDLDVSFAYDKLTSTIDCVWGYMLNVFPTRNNRATCASFQSVAH